MKLLQWRLSALLLCPLSASTITAQVLAEIKGLPFSADTVNESTQTLANGNRIHREMHGKMFRDSEGRTRNEGELLPSANKQFQVTISDPVAQVLIFLNTENKTAKVQHLLKPASQTSTIASQEPPVAAAQMPIAKTENLGSKEIEGFVVTGTRRSRTIPAGQEGNDKPITTVNETWYSLDLKMPLLTIWDNPRSGETVMRLTDIRMGDPDPLLFQVPPGYTVKEVSSQ